MSTDQHPPITDSDARQQGVASWAFGPDSDDRLLADAALRGLVEDLLDDKSDPQTQQRTALANFCIDLQQQLFSREEILADTHTGKTVTRYLVEYADASIVREIGQYISQSSTEIRNVGRFDVLGGTLVILLQKMTQRLYRMAKMGEGPLGSASEINAIKTWENSLRRMEDDYERARKLDQLTKAAEEAVSEANHARDSAKRAAGDTGNITLASHFGSLARQEGTRAFRWTLTAIGGLVVALGIGIWVLAQNSSEVWTSVLAHLTLTLPALAVAAYAARIASHHRSSALWSRTMAVQLNSLSAFLEQIPAAASREQIVLALGLRVFSAPDLHDGSATEQVSIVPTNLTETLKDLAQVLREKSTPSP